MLRLVQTTPTDLDDVFDARELDAQLDRLLATLRTTKRPLSIDDAVALTGRLQLQLVSTEKHRRYLNRLIGLALSRITSNGGTHRETIELVSRRLWTEHRIRAATAHLLECQRLATLMEEMAMEPSETLGQPAAADRGGADQRQSRLRHDHHSIPRSRDYLHFVRQFVCAVCGEIGEAHHALGSARAGLKPSDFAALPLCHRHHRGLRRRGREAFEQRHELSLTELAFNLVHKYITDEWVTLELARRS